MLKNIISIFVLVVFISACSNKASVWVDNPLSEALTVKIGGESFTIPPSEGEYRDLPKGEIEFEAKSASHDFKGKANIEGEGLLNLTGEKYVIWKDLYVNEDQRVQIPKGVIKEDTIVVDSAIYIGDFQWHSPTDYFIAKNWDLDVLTPFPDTLKLKEGEHKTMMKIFRMMDFQADYNRTNTEVDPEAYINDVFKDAMDTMSPKEKKTIDSLIQALKKANADLKK